ncbi:hypothetical protein EDB84DRAFT_355593, partial [Lactarius hengduanensis]
HQENVFSLRATVLFYENTQVSRSPLAVTLSSRSERYHENFPVFLINKTAFKPTCYTAYALGTPSLTTALWSTPFRSICLHSTLLCPTPKSQRGMDPNPPDMMGEEGAVPQVPPLEALAPALPQEAFTAIQTVLHNLDQRISAAKSNSVTSQNLQNIIQSAFSNAHITINAPSTTQTPTYFNPPEIKLSPFYGKDTENIRI